MKTPKFGFNLIQSFIDFFNNIGRIRFGSEGKRLFVESEFNSVQSKQYLSNEDGALSFVGNSVAEIFDGEVDLSRSVLIYAYYEMTTDMEVSVKSSPALILGGYAELTFIGDGSHTPTFADMTATPSSDEYDNTSEAVNKVRVYFDGVTVFYTITVMS